MELGVQGFNPCISSEGENMNELLFSEYERISENLELCLKGFEDICQYCKNLKEIPKEVQVIGFIIENTISKLKKGEENNG